MLTLVEEKRNQLNYKTMKSTAIIKKNLISRIESSNDERFLIALQTIFDSTEQELYTPSSKELESIEAGRKDIEEGKYKPHNDVMKDVAEWLEKK